MNSKSKGRQSGGGVDSKLELWSQQITGAKPGEEGVYLRLLTDRQGRLFWDLRFLGRNKNSGALFKTSYGITLDEGQQPTLLAAIDAIKVQQAKLALDKLAVGR